MSTYQQALKSLNKSQRQAVETIDGPVLVIAGPGTGKTQLLTTRIAHILHETDTLPQNILCLTFTDAAAHTMRSRLAGMIGQAAYEVTISTYHAFGAELIRRHPDYFPEMNDLEPADDLLIDRTFRDILASLSFSNPLKFADAYLKDVKTFVSDAKRTLLTPEDILKVALQNEKFTQKTSKITTDSLQGLVRIDKKAMPLFEQLHDKIATIAEPHEPVRGVTPLSTLLLHDLREANTHAAESGKTSELTKWKNTWLAKNENGDFVLAAEKTTAKLRAAADIYKKYLAELAARGLYDYDDMILRAVHALKQHADFRFTLQEQYQYLLLDEFQDTNGAQLRLVELLTDNPASEGRPNVLAVGDDDQAIYAFQGANYSHMLKFKELYRDVLTIPLTQNYRSHGDILSLASQVSSQIEERLIADKPLEAAGGIQKSIIERREAKSDAAQFAWTAEQIKTLIEQGTPASEIAVLAPKHKHLEPLLPFLRQKNIPVHYEKRENILDDIKINQLLRMSELALALGTGKHQQNALWSEVLSFDFWNIPTSQLWQLSWQAHDNHQTWAEILMQDKQLRPIALFFVRLGMLASTETCETMLDYLIGVTSLDLQEPDQPAFRSPFYGHYFGDLHAAITADKPADFWDLLSNLVVLRARLREYSRSQEERLHLRDFVTFVAAHRQADIKILNTNPHREADEAVQMMTAYKSKGQEFAAVFLLGVNDEIWGSKARTQSARLSLPQNLHFMRYAGATNDERLRLFYVALTRAKTQLYLVNYTANFAGKLLTRLKYLNEISDDNGQTISPLLPDNQQTVLETRDTTAPTAELESYWQQRHETSLTDGRLQELLKQRIANFRLSPTHVTSFIDLENQGPNYFFMNTILRFPQAPIPQGEYGNAMHETLEWVHRHNKKQGNIPTIEQTREQFASQLQRKTLSEQDYNLFLERGQLALQAYLDQRGHTIHSDNESEINFRNEGIFIGECWLNGHIDKLIVDRQNKTIIIVDYKTGKSHARWANEAKLHRYKIQLYLYKTLVEKSHTWAGYTVTDAYLEFIEPDEAGKITELHLEFSEQEQERVNKLAERVWRHIQSMQLPDVSRFTTDLKGIEEFETHLLQDDSSEQTSLWS